MWGGVGWHGHCRLLSCIPGLHPLDAYGVGTSSIPQVVITKKSPDTANVPRGQLRTPELEYQEATKHGRQQGLNDDHIISLSTQWSTSRCQAGNLLPGRASHSFSLRNQGKRSHPHLTDEANEAKRGTGLARQELSLEPENQTGDSASHLGQHLELPVTNGCEDKVASGMFPPALPFMGHPGMVSMP